MSCIGTARCSGRDANVSPPDVRRGCARRLPSANLGEVLSQMDFPSGPWTGFYNYGRSTRKQRMDLALSFADQAVTGDGNDDIGRFFVTGRFDGTNGECYWTKTYIGGARPLLSRIPRRQRHLGEYGNYLTSQVAFTFGRSENKKANTVKRARKSRQT